MISYYVTFHDSFIITGTFVVYWHNNFGPIIYVWVFLALAYFKNPLLVQSEYFLSSRVSKWLVAPQKDFKSLKKENLFSDMKELFNLAWGF